MSQPTVDAISQQAAGNARPPEVTLTERIRERPLLWLGLAGLAGFVIGGGAASRTGSATLMLIARIWLRQAASDALVSAIVSDGTAKRNYSGRP
jgi:hypothetical protein